MTNLSDTSLNNGKLQVYYDGLCHLCSREIDHYKKLQGSENISFIDITDPSFDPKKEKLDPFAVHKFMHARTAEGQIHTKVDAFVEIWKLLPKYQKALFLLKSPILRPIIDLAYITFAQYIRPYLPKKDKSCSESPYCETDSLKKK